MQMTEIISTCHHYFKNTVLRKISIPIVSLPSVELFLMTLKKQTQQTVRPSYYYLLNSKL